MNETIEFEIEAKGDSDCAFGQTATQNIPLVNGAEMHMILASRVQDVCYRVTIVPLEPETELFSDWDEAPDWAKWIAQDKDGTWIGFENPPKDPIADDGMWRSSTGRWDSVVSGRPRPDWRDTLQKRPEPEPPSWDNAPDWALWLAQNGGGTWYWYLERPTPGFESFNPQGFRYDQIFCALVTGYPNRNWRDTLQKRPEPELQVESVGNTMTVTKHTNGMQVMVDNNASGRACADVPGGTITLNTVITSRGRWIQVSFEPDEPKQEPEPELKPCPFCGDSPFIDTRDTFGRFQVRCPSCSTGQTRWANFRKDAVAAWNRRA